MRTNHLAGRFWLSVPNRSRAGGVLSRWNPFAWLSIPPLNRVAGQERSVDVEGLASDGPQARFI